MCSVEFLHRFCSDRRLLIVLTHRTFRDFDSLRPDLLEKLFYISISLVAII